MLLLPASGSGAERAGREPPGDVTLAHRSDHVDALAAGLGVTEFAPSGKAADEIRALLHWLWVKLQRLDNSQLDAEEEEDGDGT